MLPGLPLPVHRRRQRPAPKPKGKVRVTGEHLTSLTAYAELFNRVAAIPLNQSITFQRYYIAAHFRPRPGDRILDVGAYVGNNLLRYAEDGHFIDGIEVGRAYCDVWDRRRAEMSEEARGRTRMFCSLFEEWQADRAYDQALCCEVLEHVIDPQSFVAKIASHLGPGGQAFMASPKEKTRTSARLVSGEDLRAWAEKAGLKVVRVFEAVPYKPKDRKGLAGWIHKAWIRTFHKEQFNRPRDWGVAQWVCIAEKGKP